MNFDILDLIVNCTFWVFITVWFSFFAEDTVFKIIAIASVCITLVTSLVGKYMVCRRLEE